MGEAGGVWVEINYSGMPISQSLHFRLYRIYNAVTVDDNSEDKIAMSAIVEIVNL
jgi:hypothetical protein